MENLKRVLVGWFALQQWLIGVACFGGALILAGVFGEEPVASTLSFLRVGSQIPFVFSSPEIGAIFLAIAGSFSIFLQWLAKKFMFRLMVLIAAGAIVAWFFLEFSQIK